MKNIVKKNLKAKFGKKKIIQKTLSGEVVKIWDSLRQTEQEGKFNWRGVSNVCHGVKNTHAGYVWEFLNPEDKYTQLRGSKHAMD